MLALGLNFATRDEIAAQKVEVAATVLEPPRLEKGQLHFVVMKGKNFTASNDIKDCDPEVCEVSPRRHRKDN